MSGPRPRARRGPAGRGSLRTARAPRASSRSARGSQLAVIDERDLAEAAVDVQSDRPHLILPSNGCQRRGEPVGKRHRRIRAQSTTGQVAGAATEKSGSRPIDEKRPAEPAFSQKALSQSAQRRSAAGGQPSGVIFMPGGGGALDTLIQSSGMRGQAVSAHRDVVVRNDANQVESARLQHMAASRLCACGPGNGEDCRGREGVGSPKTPAAPT